MLPRRTAALAMLGATLGCPSPPPTFGTSAADGVADSLDDGDGGTQTEGDDGVDDGVDGKDDGAESDDSMVESDGTDDSAADCPGGMELGEACDPFEDACGECSKCTAHGSAPMVGWDESSCAPVQPDAAGLGEPCMFLDEDNGFQTALDTCDEDTYCWNVDGNGQGTCTAPCEGTARNPSCAAAGEVCLLNGTFAVCVAACDPVLQDCEAGYGCYPFNGEDFGCATDASAMTGGGFGDPCEYLNACQPGNMCVGQESVPDCMALGCCTPFCDLGNMGADCPNGTDCMEYYSMPPDGYEHVGVCVIAGG